MPRKINRERDLEVLAYLKTHTYIQTQNHFAISAMQIARIKKRNTNATNTNTTNTNTNTNITTNTTIAEDLSDFKKLTDIFPPIFKKHRTISEARIRELLVSEDHTDKYLRNIIFKGLEITLSDLVKKQVHIAF